MESPDPIRGREQLVRKNSSRGASSSSGTPRPRQANDPIVEPPIRTPSTRIDAKATTVDNHATVIIKIYPAFNSDMSYSREVRHAEPNWPPVTLRADSTRGSADEIAFKIGLDSLHRIINMANFYKIAQATYAEHRRYLIESTLHLASISERLGSPTKERDPDTLQTKTKSLLYTFQDSFRRQVIGPPRKKLPCKKSQCNLEEEAPSTKPSKKFSKVSSSYTQVPYLHILKVALGFCTACNDPRGFLSRTDMGKLKMKISKAELEATKKKKKDKQSQQRVGAFSRTKAVSAQP
ncbi:hypothetical protein FNV43_RR13522 [Rhamnella rubrinervis]|uniref:Uncharacterized protein n=1 Tax=Rhamnella rubrinervis TaxID=2594499 RepID=A0A8K0H197_9ROSA|nr:hypothetical protein FNV43_RR13522 [Rhamnella rubrinervis]